MNEAIYAPTIAKVKEKRQKHGRLTLCEWSTHSSGMMFNSNSSQSRAVRRNGDEMIYTSSIMPAFQPNSTSVYTLNSNSVFVKLEELIERENLTAWSELKYVNTVQIMDYSSSEGITLVFDDAPVGGRPYVWSHIDVNAARQQGGGEVIDELLMILGVAADSGSLVSHETVERGRTPLEQAMGMGYMGIPVKQDNTADRNAVSAEVPPESEWICPNCKTVCSRGKFCAECGTKRQ